MASSEPPVLGTTADALDWLAVCVLGKLSYGRLPGIMLLIFSITASAVSSEGFLFLVFKF